MTRLRLGVCLSITGRYARFGTQAAAGLQAAADLIHDLDIIVADDTSEPSRVGPGLRDVAARCDLLLGPYSTQLMRAANRVVEEFAQPLWNHGGSGDDVERECPGQVISVLTPTSRYAEPFVQMLANRDTHVPLWLRHGKGRFGRQVIGGADSFATKLGLATQRLPSDREPAGEWDLFCAATFEEDVETVRWALSLPNPPRTIGSVAAGVRQFYDEVPESDGSYGIAQWLPGTTQRVQLGPSEAEFLRAYGSPAPDYPAVQAAAAAILSTHCAREAGDTGRAALWDAAAALHASTMFGPFGIDPTTGAQRDHQTVLTRWSAGTIEIVPTD